MSLVAVMDHVSVSSSRPLSSLVLQCACWLLLSASVDSSSWQPATATTTVLQSAGAAVEQGTTTTRRPRPAGDDDDDDDDGGVPRFVLDLSAVYYVERGGTATLSCGASPAVQIGVQCSGHWVEPGRHVTRLATDQRSGRRYLQTTVNVTLLEDDVDDDDAASTVACECHAWNSVPPHLQSARGRTATLRLACQYPSMCLLNRSVARACCKSLRHWLTAAP